MNQKRFNEIVEDTLKRCKDVLGVKQDEYNLTEDRFDTFKMGAGLTGWKEDQVLLGFVTKHLISIISMINSDQQFTKDRVDEKIGDAINYLLLLRGLWEEIGKIKEDNK